MGHLDVWIKIALLLGRYTLFVSITIIDVDANTQAEIALTLTKATMAKSPLVSFLISYRLFSLAGFFSMFWVSIITKTLG